MSTKTMPESPKDWPEKENDMLILQALIADIRAFRAEAEKQAADPPVAKAA